MRIDFQEMSGDTADVATPPNWLSELEERRAKKLNALRLGHEAGAGAPCLECKEKCPGLDLHFWRKICKLCKCGKEQHGVHDEDAFAGWLHFHLLGARSASARRTAPHLSGQLELDWSPKGSHDAVERYLQEMPEERLPVKGTLAAQQRQQMLRKQVPMHDMDASLCHALSPQEVALLNDYASHLQEASAGVGHVAAIRTQNDKSRNLNENPPTYAVFLDADGGVCRDTRGDPVTALLDRLHLPVTDAAVVEALQGVAPSVAVLLDGSGQAMYAQRVDTLANERRPHCGLLLDEHEVPLKVAAGSPIRVALDAFLRPQYDTVACEQLGTRRPAYVGYLDRSGAPILDKHGSPIKNVAHSSIALADVLDQDENALLDQHGVPIQTLVDILGRPIRNSPTLGAARFTRRVDGAHIQPIAYLQVPSVADAHSQPAIAKPQWSRSLGECNPLPDLSALHLEEQQEAASISCHRCRKPFEDNALVVEIARSTARWHPACFRCAGCNQLLQDLVYCFHRDSDDVYCARDYAKMRGVPRCLACDELIFVKEYCLAESGTYHLKHFACFECDTPLADRDYVLLEAAQPTCLDCYHRLKADTCLGCGRIIAASEQGVRLHAGEHFHARATCFACTRCRAPLLGARFLFRQRRLFCSTACLGAVATS